MISSASSAVSVRLARGADLERIAAIERMSFSDPWTVDALASALALPQARFFVAELAADASAGRDGGARLVGYVVALFMADEGEIADLAVFPAARRQGIGGRLLDRVLAEAVEAGIRALYLEVRETNTAAQALYASRRFTAVGRRRGYYQRPVEDALVLRRDLAPM